LRTPITRIKLRAQFIQDDSVSVSVLSDLDEMEAMITDTLAFAREDSASELKTHIDLVSMVSSICDSMSDQGYEVVFSSESQRVALWARPIALKRAFNNIIGNAVRYASVVDVSIQLQHDSVRFVVKDDGPGIPKDELKQVFEPFYRAESSRSRDTGGVGLGLAVTRDIVKAHAGRIELNNRDGGGLCAIIQFPLESVDA
jgi:signal transduction histidine kinase